MCQQTVHDIVGQLILGAAAIISELNVVFCTKDVPYSCTSIDRR